MSGGNTMQKKKKGRQTIWSIEMLEEFRDHLINSILPYICFVLKERVNRIDLTNTSKKHRIYFLCELLGFEDVYAGLNPLDSVTEEYRDHLGYIEILNGNSEELEPMQIVRGFIKQDIAFFESLSKMAIESRLLNPKNSMMALTIHFDPSAIRELRNIPAENLLNMKLPIKTIEISQRLSFI
jgi:hypothetical protein